MKIALLSTNDITGGAAIVTLRLTRALRRAGVDATMLAARRASDNPEVVGAGSHRRFMLASYGERLRIFLANGLDRAGLFTVDIGRAGLPLHRHPQVREADVVVVAWINQGMLSLRELERIAAEKPVVVVMHDMWWLTGVCHHAGECARFRQGCGDCPMLGRGARSADFSASTWRLKKRVYANPDIHFVAVSTWLRDRCLESPLMEGKEVEVIPNPFPVEEFADGPRLSAEELGLPPMTPDRTVVAMGAARLDDPIKGFPLAIDTLNILAAEHPETQPYAIFFGALRDPLALERLNVPYTWLGPLSDPRAIRAVYHAADTVLSTSSYETLPTTLIEGQASGCFPVSFNRGGQTDIVADGVTGALASWPDTSALASGITLGHTLRCDDPSLQTRLLASAARFAAPAIAARYLALFRRLLA
jgi:hypothetical protein